MRQTSHVNDFVNAKSRAKEKPLLVFGPCQFLNKLTVHIIVQIFKVWNSGTGEEMVTFTGHADIVRCCCYSPDGSRIVSCSDDTHVKVCGVVLRYHPGKKFISFPKLQFLDE